MPDITQGKEEAEREAYHHHVDRVADDPKNRRYEEDQRQQNQASESQTGEQDRLGHEGDQQAARIEHWTSLTDASIAQLSLIKCCVPLITAFNYPDRDQIRPRPGGEADFRPGHTPLSSSP